MMKTTLSALAIAVAATVTQAHEAPIDEHTQLIPIPAYSLPYGEASAKASLQAATAFLASFPEEELQNVVFEQDSAKRAQWSNLPAGIVKRVGVSIGELSDEQRGLLFEFLSSSLGAEGYESVMEVMAAEAFLSTDDRAARLQWAPENYWISFYGTPSADAPWGWQYGGHHLGLNLSIENNTVESMSPSFVGTEPAIFTYNGVDYLSVRDMHLAGYAVFRSLDENQQTAAAVDAIPDDVLTGPGQDGVVPDVIGMNVSDMTDVQRALLLSAIREWVDIQPQENAEPRMAEIISQLDQTTFAWSGSDQVNSPTYMRIQGPTLIIELLSTGGNVGNSAQGQGHYHTMYRNPTDEYGAK